MAAGLVFTLLLGLSFGLWDGAEAICQVRANTPLDCPAGWTWYRGRCFLFVKDVKRWIMAERSCLSMDGNLASYRDSDEYNFIRELIYKALSKDEPTWVGGHNSAGEYTWFWSDGSRYVFNTTWAIGEPNNVRGSEHCLELNFSGKNNTADDDCKNKHPYVCVRRL